MVSEIVYDVHQMGANGVRLFVPPFQDPVNPISIPRSWRHQSRGRADGIRAVRRRMTGSLISRPMIFGGTAASLDATRHNMIGILTEARARASVPDHAPVDPFASRGGVNYPAPWPGGTWHLGDIVRYELITSEALVHLAARDRINVIDRFVGLGRGRRGRSRRKSIRVCVTGRAERPGELARSPTSRGGRCRGLARRRAVFRGGPELFGGSLVVPMAQPYRAHAKDLLEPQHYTPVNDRPPYDVAGWTLPFTMGVRADVVNTPFTRIW